MSDPGRLRRDFWMALAERCLGRDLVDEVVGDLLEERSENANPRAITMLRGLASVVTVRVWLWLCSLEPLETLRSLRADAALTLRSMRRRPALLGAALATLALGVGATTAMFSVVRGVLLRPLPFAEPDRLLRIGERYSTAEQVALFEEVEALETVSALGAAGGILEHDGRAVELSGLFVDGRHHELFGIAPQLGRGLEPADALPGAEPVVVLGADSWRRYFEADPHVVGRRIRLSLEGARLHTVVGVHTQFYRPNGWSADFLAPHRYRVGEHDWTDMARFWAVARLADGVDRTVAVARVRAAATRAAAEGRAFDRESAVSLPVRGLLDVQVDAMERRLWLLLGVVGLVLLVACANVANLLLVRGIGRRQEFSLRRALGAGRARIARQLITEGMVLASLGGSCGVALAYVSLPRLLDRLPIALPRTESIQVDAQVLTFSVLVTALVGVLFGLVPLLRVQSPGSARSTGSGRGARRANNVLVAGQLALCAVLLTSCGLLVRSLQQLQTVDSGLRLEGLHAVRISTPADRLGEEARRAYLERVEQEVRSLPGVASVGAISNLPLTRSLLGVGISPTGAALPKGERSLLVNYRAVTPGYFETADIPLLAGRLLTESDRAGTLAVGLINRRLAEHLWPGEDAVGRTLVWGTGEPWFTVAGVVGDVRQVDLATPTRVEVYVPYAQESWVEGMHLMVRIALSTGIDLDRLQRAIDSVDPLVPVGRPRSMQEVLAASMATDRFQAGFFGGFAAIGLLLAIVGVYGVTAFVISQRSPEFGVRMALGADRGRLIGLVVRGNLRALGAGVAVGLVGSWMAARSLAGVRAYGVPESAINLADAVVFAGVAISLVLIAVLVSGLAARRISRAAPMPLLSAD